MTVRHWVLPAVTLLTLSALVSGCTYSGPATGAQSGANTGFAQESTLTPNQAGSEAEIDPCRQVELRQQLLEAFDLPVSVACLPAPKGLLTIEIGTGGRPLPTSKDEGALPVRLTFHSDDAVLRAPGTIKVQGSSTAGWPKKNWSLKLYTNAERDVELPLQIGDSVPSDSWVAKAEWIDPSQLRNHIAYNLWGDMARARSTSPEADSSSPSFEVNHSDGPHYDGATGYPKTFLAQVLVNGEHYGISTLTLGRDPANFNIDANNPKHSYLEFDARGGSDPEKDWSKFSTWSTDTHLESYLSEDGSLNADEARSLNYLGALLNGSQENFEEMFDHYLDLDNAVDMLLYLEVLHDWDAVAQDVQLVSYDSQHWYFLPWDKDTTFGMSWDGSGIMKGSEEQLLINYETENPTQKPWYKTYVAFQPQVEARYAELRDAGVFTTENIQSYVDDANKRIPRSVWKAERDTWDEVGRPSVDEADGQQLVEWFDARLTVLDDHFNYRGA